MKSRILTLKQLKKAGACEDQCNLFKKLFGSEVRVTVSLAKKHCNKFDWEWVAENLLTDSAWTEYMSITDSAWTEYKKIEWLTECSKASLAWEKYEKIAAPVWAKQYINDTEE
jgi:hypothetical protein